MDFTTDAKWTIKEIDINEIFDKKCPFCKSTDIKQRSSRIRKVQDLGSPLEKVTINLTVRTYDCLACERQFSPEHPLFPPDYEVSKSILEYALTRYNYHNVSGNAIARDLKILHHVDVSEQTVYSWMKKHSPEFIKSKLDDNINNRPQNVKAISIDGTYTNLMKDIVGKKKHVESLSVTALENGQFLLMWWE